jgi:hypothetical protein
MKSAHEDLVVPALGMKKPIDFNTVGDDDYDGGSKDGGAGSIEGVNAS